MAPLEGPVGIGALLDAVLFGCVIVQSCLYCKNAAGDTWCLKTLVSLILFLLLSHLIFTTAWLCASRDASIPEYAYILFGVSSVLAAAISFLQRYFFSHRILKMSNNHVLAFVFFTCCIFSFTAALGGACTFFSNTTVELTGQLGSSWVFPVVFIFGLVCDLAISAVTTFCLRYQTPSEVAGTLGPATRILLIAAETSTLTSVVDVAAVLVYWLTKTNLAWVGLLVAMPGVSANALLVALNARGQLCAEIQHERVFEIGESLIDKTVKRPPIMVTISQRVDKRSERCPV